MTTIFYQDHFDRPLPLSFLLFERVGQRVHAAHEDGNDALELATVV